MMIIVNPRAPRSSPPTQHKLQMGSNTGALSHFMPCPVSGWEIEPFKLPFQPLQVGVQVGSVEGGGALSEAGA
jgi:hypothetical protein